MYDEMAGFGNKRCLTALARVSLVLLAGVAAIGSARADGFTLNAKLGGYFEMDTNPLLDRKGEKTLYGWNSVPELILTGRTPDLTLDVDTFVSDGRFNLQQFNSTDVHNYSTLNYQGDDYYLKFAEGFTFDTTRTSEIQSSGNNVAGVRHYGITLQPEFGYNINEVQQIVVTANYLANFYDNTSEFTNFESYGISPKFLYAFTLRDTGFVALQASHFDTLSGRSSEGDSVGPYIGWIHHFSNRFTTTADVGYHIIHNNSDRDGTSWDNDYFYDFALTYGVEGQDPDVVTLSVARKLVPQSSAQQVTQTAISLKETHHFTPRFAGVVDFTYHNQDYSLSKDGHLKDYIEGSAALQYNVTRELVVGSSYRYRQESQFGESGTAKGHTVMLTVTYSPFTPLTSW